jgi:hypothetical protein
MHYMTHRSHQIQKHKFGVMRLDSLFVESLLVPPVHEKCCIDVSQTECTGIHYVALRSHQIQKYKFGVMYPDALFLETALGPPEHEK